MRKWLYYSLIVATVSAISAAGGLLWHSKAANERVACQKIETEYKLQLKRIASLYGDENNDNTVSGEERTNLLNKIFSGRKVDEGIAQKLGYNELEYRYQKDEKGSETVAYVTNKGGTPPSWEVVGGKEPTIEELLKILNMYEKERAESSGLAY